MEYRRIQRRRVRGWKMPDNTVYVGRPTKWGNPYSVSMCQGGGHGVFLKGNACALVVLGSKIEAMKYAVILYRDVVFKMDCDLGELKGKNLMCWCREGDICHGDVLLEMANK